MIVLVYLEYMYLEYVDVADKNKITHQEAHHEDQDAMRMACKHHPQPVEAPRAGHCDCLGSLGRVLARCRGDGVRVG